MRGRQDTKQRPGRADGNDVMIRFHLISPFMSPLARSLGHQHCQGRSGTSPWAWALRVGAFLLFLSVSGGRHPVSPVETVDKCWRAQNPTVGGLVLPARSAINAHICRTVCDVLSMHPIPQEESIVQRKRPPNYSRHINTSPRTSGRFETRQLTGLLHGCDVAQVSAGQSPTAV